MRHLDDHEKPVAESNTSIRVPSRRGRFEEKPSRSGGDGFKQEPWPVRPQFARLPLEVLHDGRLTHSDLKVYCEMAYASRGGSVSIGVRRVGGRANLSKSEVARSLRRLCELGHLRAGGASNGKRKIYVLESLVFGDIAYTQKTGMPYRTQITDDYWTPMRRIPKSMKQKADGELPEGVKSAPRGWRKEKAG